MFLFMEKVSFLKLRDPLKAIFVFDKRGSNNTNLGGINGEKNAQIISLTFNFKCFWNFRSKVKVVSNQMQRKMN